MLHVQSELLNMQSAASSVASASLEKHMGSLHSQVGPAGSCAACPGNQGKHTSGLSATLIIQLLDGVKKGIRC